MLALRRVSSIYQYIHPLSSYQYRFKSKKSTNDESKQKSTQLSEELLDFEQKGSNIPQNISRNKKYSINQDKIEKKQSITRKQFDFLSLLYRFLSFSKVKNYHQMKIIIKQKIFFEV